MISKFLCYIFLNMYLVKEDGAVGFAETLFAEKVAKLHWFPLGNVWNMGINVIIFPIVWK